MSKHDENRDVQILNRKFKVNPAGKLIHASHSQIIGNKSWGRIDYLCHYCGYHLVYGDTFLVNKTNYEDNTDKKSELRNLKKASKEHQLSDKTKRNGNRR